MIKWKKHLRVAVVWILACVFAEVLFLVFPREYLPIVLMLSYLFGSVAGLYTFTEYF